MKPVEFPEQNSTFAKCQPPYQALPSYISVDGRLVSCWQMSWRERFHVLLTGKVWVQLLTFNQRPQPQLLAVEHPFTRSSA